MRVAIIGTAPASVQLAPYQDKSWEIWACSAGNRSALPRVSIWFELHAIREMMSAEMKAMAEPYFAWLKEQSEKDAFQVVMQEINELVPKAIPFPRDEMVYKFGHNWFTSTIAWMMALAIDRGAEEIGLWGVDMAADQEHYTGQRAGCARFMEIAAERGIKVTVPTESCLAQAPPLYGYEEATAMGRRINAVLLLAMNQRAALAAQVDRTRLEQAFYDGAMEQLRYFKRTWLDGQEAELNFGPLADAAKVYADKLARGESLHGRLPAPAIEALKPMPEMTLIPASASTPAAAAPAVHEIVPAAFVAPAILTGGAGGHPGLNGSGGSGGQLYVER